MIVFVAAVAAYLPSLTYDFTGWDDTAYIVDNPHMRHVDGLQSIWFSRENEAYYPLTFTAFWLQYQLFGDGPMGYHVVCVLMHGINAAFVSVVLRRLAFGQLAAFLAALLFAIHPVHAMTVAFVAEQKNLISCFFVLAAMYAWIRSHEGSRLWYAAALAAYAAATLAKSAVLGLPIALVALDVFVLGKGVAGSLRRILPMFVVAGLSALLTVMFEQKFIDPGDAGGIPPLVERVLLCAAAPWWYIRHLAVPIDLSPFYPLWSISRVNWLWWIAPATWLMLGILALTSLRRPPNRIRGLSIWGVTHFVMLLGPSLGLIPFGNMHATFVSDHFLYVPGIGLLALAGYGAAEVILRRRLSVVAVVVVVASLTIQTLRYQPMFRNEMALWTRGIERSPDNYVTNIGMAVALMNRAIETGNPAHRTQAGVFLDRAKSIQPRMADAYFHSGENQLELGNMEAAERDLRQHLDYNPNFARAIEKLGFICEQTGRIDEALGHYETAARFDSGNDRAWLGLGRMYLGFLRYADAEVAFRKLIELRPDFGMAYVGLAACHRAGGNWGQAIDVLKRGIASDPDDVSARSMLALMYATAPDTRYRNGGAAVAIMEQVIQVTGRSNTQALDTLAAAYAEVGRFAEAVQASDEAAAAAEAVGNDWAAAESRRRSALYRESQPLRLPSLSRQTRGRTRP